MVGRQLHFGYSSESQFLVFLSLLGSWPRNFFGQAGLSMVGRQLHFGYSSESQFLVICRVQFHSLWAISWSSVRAELTLYLPRPRRPFGAWMCLIVSCWTDFFGG